MSDRFGGQPRVGKYGLDLKVLEDLGLNAVRLAARQGHLVVLDEIGPMELLSRKFRMAIIAALDSLMHRYPGNFAGQFQAVGVIGETSPLSFPFFDHAIQVAISKLTFPSIAVIVAPTLEEHQFTKLNLVPDVITKTIYPPIDIVSAIKRDSVFEIN